MSVKCILTEQGGKGGSSGSVVLQSIEVTTAPTKTTYYSGDTFDPAGLVLKASYGQNGVAMGEKTINAGDNGLSYNPTTLTDGITAVTVTYVDGGATATTTIPVTVNKVLVSIAVTTQPTKTAYKYGEAFSTAGMAVTATYSDNSTAVVTGWTCSPANGATFSSLGSQTITVSYTATGRTRTATTSVTVSKANGQITSFSPASATITGTNYSTGVEITVNHLGDGVITNATSNNTSAVTVTYSGNKVTVKGNGSTAGTATITVTVGAGTYHEAVTGTFTATAAYWEFGAGTGEAADAAWFAGLKSYLASNAANDSWVGKYKTVTLTAAVSGTTGSVTWDTGWANGSTVQIRVIGVNHDAANSVTFQTLNGSPTLMRFGAGNVASPSSSSSSSYDANATKWGNAACCARDACSKFYDAFPGKASIKQVTKLTNTVTSGTTMETTQDNVWLLSYDEAGVGNYQYAPAGDEFTQNGPKQAAYSYYTDATSRIKKQGDSGSANFWWLRSRGTGAAYRVGRVNNSGDASRTDYWGTTCLAPAFVIGN